MHACVWVCLCIRRANTVEEMHVYVYLYMCAFVYSCNDGNWYNTINCMELHQRNARIDCSRLAKQGKLLRDWLWYVEMSNICVCLCVCKASKRIDGKGICRVWMVHMRHDCAIMLLLDYISCAIRPSMSSVLNGRHTRKTLFKVIVLNHVQNGDSCGKKYALCFPSRVVFSVSDAVGIFQIALRFRCFNEG